MRSLHPNMLYTAVLASALLLLTSAAPPSYAVPFEDPFFEVESLLLERIVIHGSSATSDAVIDSLLGFKKGQNFDASSLAKGTARLESSELFREVELYTRPGSGPGLVVLVVRVKEERPPNFDWFDLVVQPEDKYFNIIELETYSQDRRNRLIAELRAGGLWGGLHLTGKHIVDPGRSEWFVQSGVGSEHFSFYAEEPDTGWQVPTTRLNLDLGFRLRRTQHTEVRGSIGAAYYEIEDFPSILDDEHEDEESTQISDRRLLPRTLREETGAGWLTSSLAFVHDSRDDRVYTTKGSFLHLPVELAYSPTKARLTGKVEIDARHYLPFAAGQSLAMRAHAGVTTDNAPYYQRLYLSRGYIMRGAPMQYLEQAYGATRLLHGSIEYRMPTLSHRPDPWLMLTLFSEAGTAWNDDEDALTDVNYMAPVLTVGMGMVFRIPTVGPLSLSFGFPVAGFNQGSGMSVSLEWGLMF